MDNKRFQVEKASKFEKLSNDDLQSVKGGGICLSCMKRDRRIPIRLGFEHNGSVPANKRVEYKMSSDNSHLFEN